MGRRRWCSFREEAPLLPAADPISMSRDREFSRLPVCRSKHRQVDLSTKSLRWRRTRSPIVPASLLKMPHATCPFPNTKQDSNAAQVRTAGDILAGQAYQPTPARKWTISQVHAEFGESLRITDLSPLRSIVGTDG